MTSPTQYSEEDLNQIFITACEDQQKGLLDAAQAGYLKLLSFFPEAPILHYNLGLAYYEQGAYKKALDSFRSAAILNPEDGDILFNLALSQKKNGDIEGAIGSYKQVLQNDPKSIDTLYNLGGCYRDDRQYSTAIETYLELLGLVPDHPAATNSLAYLYHRAGENQKAVVYYQKVLAHDPDHLAAKHMLASLSGGDATSTPESYVKDVFDNYSDNYEHSLVTELEYCVPDKIRALLGQSSIDRTNFEHGLDLGCGTGLSGEAFSDIVEIFDGIDLSEDMLGLAEQKNIYHTLHSGSINDFLQSTDDIFDFYIAADVFAYIGNLQETFCLLKARSRQDVLLCFSTETATGNNYQLQETGRFAHSPDYIEQLAKATGWSVLTRKTTSLRKENDGWIQGDLWFLCV